MLSEQKDHFYAILLKKDLEYNLPYHEMSQTLKSKCVCNKEGKYHGFFDRINAKEKLDYLKDKTSKHIFSHQIPTKYIQLFYQGKEVKNNRELERILDKHRRKEVKKTKQCKKRIDKYLKIQGDLTGKEGLSFTYKITYFPLLFLIYKENPA